MTRRNRNDIRLTLKADDLRAFTHTVRQLMQHSNPTDKRVHAAYRTLHQLDRAVARHKAKAGKHETNIDDRDKNQRSDDGQSGQAHEATPDHFDQDPGRKAQDG